MSSDMTPSSQIDTNRNSLSNDGNHNISDVLLYAESKITRKQAVREIADVILRANMKPRTVKHALQLVKALLPLENTLPTTVDELFGAMMSSENDWRLAQYLIRHKQRPSFLSATPNTWSENSNSNNSLIAISSSSIPRNQELNMPTHFLPISNSSSSSSSSSSNSSESSSSSSESSDDDDDDDDDERNILHALQDAQQQRLINSSPLRPITESTDVETNPNQARSSTNNESSDQRSQIVSSSLHRFPFLGSFKRQRSETSSDESASEPDLFYTTRISDDDDDDSDNETSFYPISNNNNNKSRCFEMNGCDLLDGGKRRRN